MTAAVDDRLLSFTEQQVADLAQIRRGQVKDWVDRGVVEPKLDRQFWSERTMRLYGLQAAVEVCMVAQIRRDRVPLQQTRRVLRELRSRGFMELDSIQFGYDPKGRELFWRQPNADFWEGGHRPGQGVEVRTIIDFRELRDRVRQSVGRPAKDVGKIVKVRGVQASAPVFAGTRIPVSTVESWIGAGASDRRILDAYPLLEQGDIDAARREEPVSAQ